MPTATATSGCYGWPGFSWSVIEDDLAGADREREKADAEYA
ncbi:hypothetical protein [Kribbella steppae]|nr:hypothetical protein [Kribbella steppae]